MARFSAMERALRSSSNTMNGSPAFGTSVNPVISTGVDGPASFKRRPLSFTIARTRPKQLPATKASPTLSVPCCTRIRATGPRFLSSSASITAPRARLSGFALYSLTSATSRIISSRSSRPIFCLADTLTKIVSPPHSSGTKPYSVNSCFTLSGLASGLSILLTATIIGSPAALAWLTASTVCGMTPSSAATTMMVISVNWAPRARMAVKAS
ncbi:hypothetical protein D1872_236930 [compost metagenome]